ncbi:hypothetical protein E2C01_012353 [Portunus trituberculatus]|uniref:Uncharacterized protein n=1 Tax=Portunus trituberculatus TaxID=210409 RepID=A0A5B7DDX8_PORTR|nr:hypothetical protein [Portunus trituberculatus]
MNLHQISLYRINRHVFALMMGHIAVTCCLAELLATTVVSFLGPLIGMRRPMVLVWVQNY